MADIFSEVEESLRHERYQRMARRYGPVALALAIFIVVAVAGREGWIAYKNRAAAQSSDAFAAAQTDLEAGRLDAAMSGFAELSEDGAEGYRALAKMQEAATAAVTGSLEEGARLFDEAATLTNDPLIGGMARLKAAYLLADRIEVDALEARLTPLMTRGAPYELAARELLGAAALSAGELARAREAYVYLTVALEAPGGVQRRAEEALAVIAAAEASQTDEEG